jgi:hypothetical protein
VWVLLRKPKRRDEITLAGESDVRTNFTARRTVDGFAVKLSDVSDA